MMFDARFFIIMTIDPAIVATLRQSTAIFYVGMPKYCANLLGEVMERANHWGRVSPTPCVPLVVH